MDTAGVLQDCRHISRYRSSAEPLASIFGVINDDPTFFFPRVNSPAQEHSHEKQLRRGSAGHFLLFATGPDDLACLAASVRNGHRHDVVLCRLTDLSINSKPVGAVSLGSNRKSFLSKSSVTNLASFRADAFNTGPFVEPAQTSLLLVKSRRRNVRFGSKQTYVQKGMSALPPKADMCDARGHVCFGPIADMQTDGALLTSFA